MTSDAGKRLPSAADGRIRIRLVEDDQWETVAWLWQAFRHDLAPIVHGLPYADGRYNRGQLAAFPSADGVGYLAWRPHPNTGEDAPIGFALVDGLLADRRTFAGFWIAPAARRGGTGRALALEVLARHPGAWQIAFQHDNRAAGAFWRSVADDAFGPGRWTEAERPVPGRPGVPPDHFLETMA